MDRNIIPAGCFRGIRTTEPSKAVRSYVPPFQHENANTITRRTLSLQFEERDGEVLFRVNPRKGKDAAHLSEMVCDWALIAGEFRAGEISKDDYDKWCYNYLQYDDTKTWAKVPSQELSDI